MGTTTFKHYFRQDGNVFGSDHPQFHQDAEKLERAEGIRLYREQVKAELRTFLKPRDTVYTNVVSVARSGMSRRVAVYVPYKDQRYDGKREKYVPHWRIRNITNLVAVALDASVSDGITVNGCGFDACFDVVYRLGRTLWPEGTKRPHRTRNGQPDRDGGYALNNERL